MNLDADGGKATEPTPYLERRADRPASTGLRSGCMERAAQDERDARATDLALSGMAPDNRALVEAFLHDRRRRIGLAQRKKYATILGEVERFLGGTPRKEVAPDQVGRWLDAAAARVGPGTIAGYATLVKSLIRWLHDDSLPRAFRKALDTGPQLDDRRQRLVPREHVLSLLHEARTDLMMQALLWILYDTGFRIEEALSLNVGSVEPFEEGFGVRIPPREKARFRLKTGPRDVWVIQCRGALESWPTAHPFAGDADKPLFVVRAENPFGPGPWMPPGPDGARRRLHVLCEAAGVPHYTPHDFRHTKAYWMKQNDWADSKMCTFMGWSDESKMPRRYGRLVAADLRATIRRDAGINNLGQKVVPSEAEAKLAQLANLLGDVLRNQSPTSPRAAPSRGGLSIVALRQGRVLGFGREPGRERRRKDGAVLRACPRVSETGNRGVRPVPVFVRHWGPQYSFASEQLNSQTCIYTIEYTLARA